MSELDKTSSSDILDIERKIALKELEIKEKQLSGRGIDQNKVVLLSAAISLISATTVAVITSYYSRDSQVSQAEVERIGAEIVQTLAGESNESIARIQAQNALDLEREKLQRDLISDAIEAGTQEETKNRLLFFAEVGLLKTYDKAIKEFIEKTNVLDLPSAAGASLIPNFDTDYDNREGYDPDFLSETIPLPTVNEALMANETLDYHHYSIIAARERPISLLAAANANFQAPLTSSEISRSEFGAERWLNDPRIAVSAQMDDSIYRPARKVDRGHLIARRYVTWGHRLSEIMFSNADAFHWTNATLQNEEFNRWGRGGVWGNIERRSFDYSERFSVFAGPISEGTGVYLAPHITDGKRVDFPLRFWKVFSDENVDGLNVLAFIFHQPIQNMADELLVDDPAVFDTWKSGVWAISLKALEAEIGYIDFPFVLHKHDVTNSEAWRDHALAQGIEMYPTN